MHNWYYKQQKKNQRPVQKEKRQFLGLAAPAGFRHQVAVVRRCSLIPGKTAPAGPGRHGRGERTVVPRY